MLIIKAILRLVAILGLVTIIPYLLWWIFTGFNWFETTDLIDVIGEK